MLWMQGSDRERRCCCRLRKVAIAAIKSTAIRRSCYQEQLPRWQVLFPAEQLLVLR